MLRINFAKLVFLASVYLLSSFVYADDDIPAIKEYATKAAILNVGDEPEGVTYNSVKKTYSIVYETFDVNGLPILYKTEYIPPVNINGKIYTKLYFDDNEISYKYIISSKKLSDESVQPQDIVMAEFNLGSSDIAAGSLNSPSGWEGIYKTGQTNIISWLFISEDDSLSVRPGKYRDGFKLKSDYLPGVVSVKVRGDVPILGLSGEIANDEIGEKVNSLLNNDYVTVYASGPVLANPSPHNPAVILKSLQVHLKDLTLLKLMTEALYFDATELIDATINAVKLNDEESAEDFLEDLSELLGVDNDHIEHDDDLNVAIGISSEIIEAFTRSLKFTIDYIEDRL